MQQSPHRGESFFRPGTLVAAAAPSGNSGPDGQPDRSATAVLRNSSEDPPATAPAAGPTDWPADTDKGDLRPGPAYEARAGESAARTGSRPSRRPNPIPPARPRKSSSPHPSTKAPLKNESLPTNDLRQERFFIRSRPPADDTAPQRLFRLRRSLLPGSGCRQNNPTADSQRAPKSHTGRNIRSEQTAGASPRPHSRSSAAAGSFLPPHARQGRQIRRDMRSGR